MQAENTHVSDLFQLAIKIDLKFGGQTGNKCNVLLLVSDCVWHCVYKESTRESTLERTAKTVP